MSKYNDKCPIWGAPAYSEARQTGDLFNSPRAGGIFFRHSKVENITYYLKEDRDAQVKITDWIIENQNPDGDAPKLMHSVIEDEILPRPRKSARQQCEDLLTKLTSDYPRIGERIIIDYYGETENQYEFLKFSHSIDGDDLIELLTELRDRGWVRQLNGDDAWNRQIASFKITTDGREYAAGLTKNADSKQGFVAMWFDNQVNDAYQKGILPVIEEAGFTARRIDELEHNDKICDLIIAEIRKSRFVVADFTCQKIEESDLYNVRGGVYFEAGFAIGLGIPVIYTCRSDSADSLHFDTRQYNHIIWESIDDLKEKLRNRIAATIGQA